MGGGAGRPDGVPALGVDVRLALGGCSARRTRCGTATGGRRIRPTSAAIVFADRTGEGVGHVPSTPIPDGPPGSRPVTGVQSLERGLAVIRAFDAEHGRMTMSDVARRTGLSRATARRILHTLVAADYMQTDGRIFWLRPRILELGYSYLSSIGLPELATPHLKDLSERLRESSSLAVLDDTDVVYVARIPARRIMAVGITVGTRFPAYATSLGRVLLAGLTVEQCSEVLSRSSVRAFTPRTVVDGPALLDRIGEVRRQGYALVDEELELGLRSLAVPVTDHAGAVVAAVNVSVAASTATAEEMRRRFLPVLSGARDSIQADLHIGRSGRR
jgi:IclR family pca regulon transcriptional regulator